VFALIEIRLLFEISGRGLRFVGQRDAEVLCFLCIPFCPAKKTLGYFINVIDGIFARTISHRWTSDIQIP
jgi:hypothetical protein